MTESPLRLMVVTAHPDDESLGFGGVLARYADEGIETVLTLDRRDFAVYRTSNNRALKVLP